MDVFLTVGARQAIEAAASAGPKARTTGLLLGHARGPRLYVDDVLPLAGAAWPSLAAFAELDRRFEARIIGFFALNPRSMDRKSLLGPRAVGKAFLEAGPGKRGRVSYRASFVDFDGRFEFLRVRLVIERRPPAGRGQQGQP
jgi:hypothetical protein